MYYEVEAEKEFCNCGSVLKCEKIFSHHDYDEDDDPFYGIQFFKILICPACNSATVILYSALGNSYEDEENEKIGQPSFHEHSRRVLYAPKKKLHSAIPKSIAEVASQAEVVLASSPRASFILCRAVLEEICNNFEIHTEKINSKGGTTFIGLKGRLSQLFKEQEMSEDLQAIINGVKDLGDKGAHRDHLTFTEQVEVKEAENLLELVYYILERVFVDQERKRDASETLEKLKGKILSSG
jgi:hypothetical protein